MAFCGVLTLQLHGVSPSPHRPADDGMDAWKNVPDVAPMGVAPKPAVAVGALE